MENQQQRNIPTELQINGPILSFVTDPSNITVSTGQTVIFTGLATATFPTQVPANDAVGMGTIAYRWYEVGVGALSDISAPTSAIVGSATTFLQLHNPTASDRGRQFYLGADYVPNYPVPNVGFGTTTPITPNAPNEPHFSESATLDIFPEIIVDTQPSGVTVGEGAVAKFEVDARMSIDGFGDIDYQWRVDGVAVNDGTYETGNQTVVNLDKFQVLALPLWNGGAGNTLNLTDYSENAKTITPGTTEPSWSGTGPGGGGTPSWVSTGIATANFYEGAAYFNGDEYDYLNVSASEDFDFGTGDFCIELWICPLPGEWTWEVMVGVGNGAYGDGGTWFTYLRDNPYDYTNFYIANDAGYNQIARVETAAFEGNWHHLAVTRENGKIRFFMDGVNYTGGEVHNPPYANPGGTYDPASGFSRRPFGALKPGHIGMEHMDDFHNNGWYYPYAYMQDIKVYKGIAKYTEQFSPSRDPIINLKNAISYSDLTTVQSYQDGNTSEMTGWTYWTGMGQNWVNSATPTSSIPVDYINQAMPTSGKYYFETKIKNPSRLRVIGFSIGSDPQQAYNDYSLGYYYKVGLDGINNPLFLTKLGSGPSGEGRDAAALNGTVTHGASTGDSWENGDTLMWAYDATTGNVWLGHNGVWYGGGDPVAGTGPSITGAPLSTTSNIYFKQEYSGGTNQFQLTNVAELSALYYNIESPAKPLFDGDLTDAISLWTETSDYVEVDFSALPDGGLSVNSTVSVYSYGGNTTGGNMILTDTTGNTSGYPLQDTTFISDTWYTIVWGSAPATLAKIKIETSGGNGYYYPSAIKIDDKILLDPIQVTSTYATNDTATLALPLWNKDGSDKLTLEDVSTDQTSSSADPWTVSQWGEVKLPSWVSTGGKWYNGYANFPGANALEISKGGQVTEFNIGFGDFTVECWIYFHDETTNTAEDIFSTGPYGMNQFTLRRVESDQLEASWNDQIILSGGLFEPNQWYHIAVTRDKKQVWRLFIDGTMVAHRFLDTIDIAANVPVLIGQQSGNVWALDGGIQDFVVYNNLAKYTEDFIPPNRGILSYNRNFYSVSGSKTSRLSIVPANSGADIVDCVLSNPFVVGEVITDPAKLVVTEARAILKIEAYDGTSTASLSSYNLDDQEITIDSTLINSDEICLYSPEKDMDVEFDLYGAKGVDFDVWAAGMGWSSGHPAGEGGYSRISFKMKKNEEYVLKGIKSNSALFLYRKSSLIAVVGQGGDGGHYGPGGAGGGVNVAGQDGTGRLSGDGGLRIDIGALGEDGSFGSRSNIASSNVYPGDNSGRSHGQTIKCTKGVYWREQGKGACEDLGTIQYRTKDGTIVTNSALIDRGFKAGYAINTTGGKGSGDGGGGGNGATGGSGGSSSGGGGGSGYSDGSINIIDTVVGTNTAHARVNIRLGSGDFYIDDKGRILILSCATVGKHPTTLTKVTDKVMPGTDTCIDDARWQNFKNLAKDGMKNYRLTGCASAPAGTVRLGQTNATPYNMYRMMNNPCGGGVLLRDSLTDWYDTNYAYEWLSLAYDETSGDIHGYGSDYSSLSWSPAEAYGWGYYGLSRGSLWIPALQTHQIDGFFTPTTYHLYTTEFWILPPGVPDFPLS